MSDEAQRSTKLQIPFNARTIPAQQPHYEMPGWQFHKPNENGDKPAGIPRFSDGLAKYKAAPPKQFAIEFLAPMREVTLLSAHGGVGKSTIGGVMALSFAMKTDFYSLRCSYGPAIYFSAEDEESMVYQRMAAYLAATGLDKDSIRMGFLDNNLTVYDVSDNPELTAKKWNGKESTLEGLQFEIRELKAKLVIIDNASTVFTGDANDAQAVSEFLLSLKAIARSEDCAIVLLAHVNAEAGNRKSAKTYLGSTAWHNLCRSRIYMYEEDQFGETLVHLIHEKHNYSRKAPGLTFRREGETGVLRELNAAAIVQKKSEELKRLEDQLLTDIEDLYTNKNEHFVKHLTGNNSAFSKMNQFFPDRYPDNKETKNQFRQAVGNLTATGRLISSTRIRNRKTIETLVVSAASKCS